MRRVPFGIASVKNVDSGTILETLVSPVQINDFIHEFKKWQRVKR